MNIELIQENEDGSTDYNVNMSSEEQSQLFRFAFIEMLKRGIAEGKQYEPLDHTPGTEGTAELQS